MISIQLNETETSLFNDLILVIKTHNLNTVLRVAGGWVRDKLLGLESQDIDIALDNMMGEEFAKFFTQTVCASSVGKIRANPEASKHLETACVHYKSIDIDFVNLRSEDYSEDSRIPEIVISN